MPIPIHAATYLVQVVLQAEDDMNNVFNNTFFFGDGVSPPRTHAQIADAVKIVLDDFYTEVTAPATTAPDDYLSAIINPNNVVYKVYDLGQAAPRTPEVRTAAQFATGGTPLPNEVAVVLSYRSGPGTAGTGGTNDPTKRGRLFLGPLNTGAMATAASTDPDARVHASLRTALKENAEALNGNAEDLVWLQYSRKNDALGIVTGGFIENAFDTQRRRGADATARTLWT